MNLNDRLLSIRDHMYLLFQDRIASDNMRFETEGRVRNMTRPIWSIRRINHREEGLGMGGYVDVDQWSLSYFGRNRLDADTTVQKFQDSITAGGLKKNWQGRIAGWRFNWQYPSPVVTPVVGGLLPNGTYSVRVSGIDLCGSESAASPEVLVVLSGANSSLSVRILRQQVLVTLFKSYNVYVNGHLQVSVNHPVTDVPLYPRVVITQITQSGALPKEPANSVPIRWKFIRVDTYSDNIREDEISDGLFNGYITLQTSTYQERDMVQTESMMAINGAQSVVPSVPDVPVTQFLATSSNPVRIGYA